MGRADIKHYRDLKVWRDAVELVTHMYAVTKQFPAEEKFGLVSQLRRSAVSIPSNIAEGSARKTSRELLQFMTIAYGSLAEVETQLQIACNLEYIDEHTLQDFYRKTSAIGKQLNGLRNAIQMKLH